MITTSSVISCNDKHMAAEVDGQVVLMNVDTGLYFGLNEVGSAIWRRLAHPIRLAELCADLSQAYEGDAQIIERDVLTLVTKLHDRRLVEVHE